MRVHGEITIRRRDIIEKKRHYSNYSEELREDFHDMCGYCGKSYRVTKNGFEIDHFVPQKQAKELKNEYSNLVYSCHTCNRKKHDKWPTNDTNTHHNDKVGFVDPASDEYDSHISRKEDGTIVPLSKVGEYMCYKAFMFHQRPMKQIWLCECIYQRKQELRSLNRIMTTEEKDEYIELDNKIDQLMLFLLNIKE
jgi:uncharacterized protein (TIGR02646 family)